MYILIRPTDDRGSFTIHGLVEHKTSAEIWRRAGYGFVQNQYIEIAHGTNSVQAHPYVVPEEAPNTGEKSSS